MEFQFSSQFEKDLEKLRKENTKLPAKVLELMNDMKENPANPLKGIGKPELLKENLKGCYSRRISEKHRLIYKYSNNMVQLLTCYGHYE